MTKKDILTELSRPIAEHHDVNLDEMAGVLLNRRSLPTGSEKVPWPTARSAG